MKQTIEYDLSLTDDMTVGEVQKIYYDIRHNGLDMNAPDIKIKASAAQMWKTLCMLHFTNDAMGMKISELREWASVVRSAFICIHRANYSAHSAMSAFYDWFEEKRKGNAGVVKYWRKTDEEFRRYQNAHRSIQDTRSFNVLDDHLRLFDDVLQPYLRNLKNDLVNLFIRQRDGKSLNGQIDDIELLAIASVCLFFVRVIKYSYTDFFQQYKEKCGIDFSYDFRYADLTAMSRNFIWMLQQIGVKMHDNDKGEKVLDFFDVDHSSVIEVAWKKVIDVMRDEEVVDSTASAALDVNEDIKELYEEKLKEEDEKKLVESIDQLSEKYKVRR